MIRSFSRGIARALLPLTVVALTACGGQEPHEKAVDAMEDFVEVIEGI